MASDGMGTDGRGHQHASDGAVMPLTQAGQEEGVKSAAEINHAQVTTAGLLSPPGSPLGLGDTQHLQFFSSTKNTPHLHKPRGANDSITLQHIHFKRGG